MSSQGVESLITNTKCYCLYISSEETSGEQTGGHKSHIITKPCTLGGIITQQRTMIDTLEENMGYLKLQKGWKLKISIAVWNFMYKTFLVMMFALLHKVRFRAWGMTKVVVLMCVRITPHTNYKRGHNLQVPWNCSLVGSWICF